MELVTLLADDGTAIGSAPKSDVHSHSTPLHLAFSCYALDDHGRILMTRRALIKRTWPGVWTNSFCGHPAPGENPTDAVIRRGGHELGAVPVDVRVALPSFRYRATDASGIVEHEICPVHVARLADAVDPDPEEIMEWSWVAADDLLQAVALAPFAFSPWLREQLPLLRAAGEV